MRRRQRLWAQDIGERSVIRSGCKAGVGVGREGVRAGRRV